MDQFQNAIKKARNEIWDIVEATYVDIEKKEDKLLEYILIHLIKEIPNSRIRLGEKWKKGECISNANRYLEIENDFTIFLSLNDEKEKYMKKEDDITVLKQNDSLHISCYPKGKIAPSCIESIRIDDIELKSLVEKIKEMIDIVRKKFLNQ